MLTGLEGAYLPWVAAPVRVTSQHRAAAGCAHFLEEENAR